MLNNIFYMFNERIIFRNDLESFGSHYDGNVFYRDAEGTLPLFFDFGNGERYETLAEFRAISRTDWEGNGLELDPGFDTIAINSPKFNPVSLWERYRPTNQKMFTPGATYIGRAWPGTEGVNNRGALPPPKNAVGEKPPLDSSDVQDWVNDVTIFHFIIRSLLAMLR